MTEETSVEDRAKEMGWSSKEEFRGNPDQWIDAETYVQRGETLMPLIKASNRRLTEELATMKGELAEAKTQAAASQEAIAALKEFNSAANRKVMKESVASTKAALIQARRDGDPEVEIALAEQLGEEQEALRAAEKEGVKPEGGKKTNGTVEEDYTKTAEWQAWIKDNSWYTTDKRRTALAMGIAEELRTSSETTNLRGRAFLDRVTEEVEKVFSPGEPKSKVEGGGRGTGGGGGGSGGHRYSDLPQDAKETCERQSTKLVGKGRAFATTEEWRKHYAKTYFEEA
jgi:hypothetical protein